jgi:exodeoxyribonuclease VII large subunit
VGSDVTAELTGGTGAAPPSALSVTALVMRIKAALAEAFPQRITVVGEISNFKLHSSGHLYFRLKDDGAAIDAAMWRQSAAKLRFKPYDGLEVVVEGRVDMYEARGQLQLYVEQMTPKGAGALELAFRQLKEKLQKEGLFEQAAKKPIPPFPRAIGLVTSQTGAAIRDIRQTLRRRWSGIPTYLVPVAVQGEGSAAAIAEAIGLLDAQAGRYQIDTIILARGGGSMEDLWAFNEEIVARAVFAARTPIICGVGHEVDVTIADMVADLRAATPTAAAELAVPDSRDILRHLATCQNRLTRSLRDQMTSCAQCLASASRSVVFRDPTWRLRSHAQRLDELSHRLRADLGHLLAAHRRRLEPLTGRLAGLHPAALAQRARGRLERLTGRLAWALGGRSKRAGEALSVLAGRLGSATPAHRIRLLRQHLDGAARQLESMSYRSVLQRGFSVTRGSDGEILRSALAARAGQQITTELIDGRIASRVEGDSAAAQAAPLPETPAAAPRKRRDKTTHTTGPSLFGPEGET